jgi:hypothetical protein
MGGLLGLDDAVSVLLEAHAGQSVAELAAHAGAAHINLDAKNAHAVVIRRLFEERGLAAGLDQASIQVKVVRRGSDGRVFEKMTFRNFGHDELPRETWETSRFRADTRKLLIVVFEAEERGLPIGQHQLVKWLFWEPSAQEDESLKKDWERCREAVAYHLAVPRESETKAVHVGTKGRDSFDLEELKSGELVAKQCLCFNKKFVEGLIADRTS